MTLKLGEVDNTLHRHTYPEDRRKVNCLSPLWHDHANMPDFGHHVEMQLPSTQMSSNLVDTLSTPNKPIYDLLGFFWDVEYHWHFIEHLYVFQYLH